MTDTERLKNSFPEIRIKHEVEGENQMREVLYIDIDGETSEQRLTARLLVLDEAYEAFKELSDDNLKS